MNLHPYERVWFSPSLTAYNDDGEVIVTVPADWEASFDGGTTWITARDNGGEPGWLVAGAKFEGDETVPTDALVTVSVRVLIRLTVLPETIVDRSLSIAVRA